MWTSRRPAVGSSDWLDVFGNGSTGNESKILVCFRQKYSGSRILFEKKSGFVFCAPVHAALFCLADWPLLTINNEQNGCGTPTIPNAITNMNLFSTEVALIHPRAIHLTRPR